MIKKIDKVLFSSMGIVTATTVFFLVSFLMTFDLIKILDVLFVQDKSIWFAIKFVLRLVWVVSPIAVPIAVVVATVFTVNKFCKTSEFTIFRASGLSNFRLYLPIFVFAAAVSGWMYFLLATTIPLAKKSFKEEKYFLIKSAFKSRLKEKEFFTEISDLVIFVDEYNKETSEMKNIFFKMTNKESQKVVTAKKAKVHFREGAAADKNSMSLDFFNGVILDYDENKDEIKKVRFEEYNYVPDKGKSSYASVNSAIAMPTPILLKKIEALKKNGKKYLSWELEYYQRLVIPIMCLFLSYIGFYLGMSDVRSHKGNIALRTFSYLVVYYITYFGIFSIGKQGGIPTVFTLIIPLSMLLIMSVYLTYKSKWIN